MVLLVVYQTCVEPSLLYTLPQQALRTTTYLSTSNYIKKPHYLLDSVIRTWKMYVPTSTRNAGPTIGTDSTSSAIYLVRTGREKSIW